MELMVMVDMPDTHMPIVDTEPMVMDTHTELMDTMERDLLMLNQRLMLMPTQLSFMELMVIVDIPDTHMPIVDTEPMVMDTHTELLDSMERDPLMLNQRLMLMLTTDIMDMPGHMLMEDTMVDTEPTDTHMDTTERDLLMPSPRPKLTPLS